MSHEKSATITVDGRHYNVDTVGEDKGRVLGPQGGFSTIEEAESAAERRSRSFDKLKQPQQLSNIEDAPVASKQRYFGSFERVPEGYRKTVIGGEEDTDVPTEAGMIGDIPPTSSLKEIGQGLKTTFSAAMKGFAGAVGTAGTIPEIVGRQMEEGQLDALSPEFILQQYSDMDRENKSRALQGLPPLTEPPLIESLRTNPISDALIQSGQYLQGVSQEAQEYWDSTVPKEYRRPFVHYPQGSDTPVFDWSVMKDPNWWLYNSVSFLPELMLTVMTGSGAAAYAKRMGASDKLARLAGTLVGGGYGGLIEGTSTYREMIKSGAPHQQALRAATIMTFGSALLNKVALDRWLTKLPPGTVQKLTAMGWRAAVESITEYLEEPVEYAGKVAAGQKPSWDDLEKTLMEGLNVVGPTFLISLIMPGGGGAIAKQQPKPGLQPKGTRYTPEQQGNLQEQIRQWEQETGQRATTTQQKDELADWLVEEPGGRKFTPEEEMEHLTRDERAGTPPVYKPGEKPAAAPSLADLKAHEEEVRLLDEEEQRLEREIEEEQGKLTAKPMIVPKSRGAGMTEITAEGKRIRTSGDESTVEFDEEGSKMTYKREGDSVIVSDITAMRDSRTRGTEMLRWLREQNPGKRIEVTDAVEFALPFWQKMKQRGLVDEVHPSITVSEEKAAEFGLKQKAMPTGERKGVPLRENVRKAYQEQAHVQRGRPERAMLDVQGSYGGGVLSYAVEHVGDISHRMNELLFNNTDWGLEYAVPKIERSLKLLRNEYGFEREHKENVENTVRYYKERGDKPERHDVKQVNDALSAALAKYADEHRKIKVYNEAQYHAREAAVKLGEQKYDEAADHLAELKNMIDSGEFHQIMANPKLDENGNPLEYSPMKAKPIVIESADRFKKAGEKAPETKEGKVVGEIKPVQPIEKPAPAPERKASKEARTVEVKPAERTKTFFDQTPQERAIREKWAKRMEAAKKLGASHSKIMEMVEKRNRELRVANVKPKAMVAPKEDKGTFGKYRKREVTFSKEVKPGNYVKAYWYGPQKFKIEQIRTAISPYGFESFSGPYKSGGEVKVTTEEGRTMYFGKYDLERMIREMERRNNQPKPKATLYGRGWVNAKGEESSTEFSAHRAELEKQLGHPVTYRELQKYAADNKMMRVSGNGENFELFTYPTKAQMDAIVFAAQQEEKNLTVEIVNPYPGARARSVYIHPYMNAKAIRDAVIAMFDYKAQGMTSRRPPLRADEIPLGPDEAMKQEVNDASLKRRISLLRRVSDAYLAMHSRGMAVKKFGEDYVRWVEQTAAEFGHDVVFFAEPKWAESGLAGVTLVNEPGEGGLPTVFINVSDHQNAVAPHVALGHEMTHLMRAFEPKMYDRLVRVAKFKMSHSQESAHWIHKFKYLPITEKNVDEYKEELISDFIGDNLLSPEFLAEVARHDKSLATRLMDYIRNILEKVNKNVEVFGGFERQTNRGNEWFGNPDELFKEAAKVIADYKKSRMDSIATMKMGLRPMSMPAGKRRKGRRVERPIDAVELWLKDGINRKEAEAQGIDPAEFKRKVNGKWLYPPKGGLTFDGAAEVGQENGLDIYGPNKVLEILDAFSRGHQLTTDALDQLISDMEDNERAMLEDDSMHKKYGTGRIVGAADWIKTGKDFARFRMTIQQLFDEGKSRLNWYEESGKAILDYFGGDVEEAIKFAKVLAIYSKQQQVEGNMTQALKAWKQYKRGLRTFKVGMEDSDIAAANFLWEGKEWEGLKTNAFYKNLMWGIDPSQASSDVTVDMWMMSALDYHTQKASPEQYKFIAREIERLAEQNGVPAHQAQAAIWSAFRARARMSRSFLDARAELKGIEDKSPEWQHLQHQLAMEENMDPKDVYPLSGNFAEALRDRSVQITGDVAPSYKSGHLRGWSFVPLPMQRDFADEIHGIIGNYVHETVGFEALGQRVDAFFVSDAEVGLTQHMFVPHSAVREQRPLLTTGEMSKTKYETISAEDRKRLNIANAMFAYLNTQQESLWFYPVYNAPKKLRDGYDMEFNRPMTVQETRQLADALNAKFGQWIAPSGLESGARIINLTQRDYIRKEWGIKNKDVISNEDFQKGVQEILEDLPNGFAGGVLRGRGFQDHGEYLLHRWEDDPSGQGLLDKIPEEYHAELKKRRMKILGVYKKYGSTPEAKRAAQLKDELDRENDLRPKAAVYGPGKYVFHVTFSKNAPKIKKGGLQQFKTSNWAKAGTGERYNEEGGIFAFEHPEDAWKWAFKMQWEFKQPVSIVRLRPGEGWEQDPSEDINLQLGKGKSLRKLGAEPKESIVDVFSMDDFERGEMSQEEWMQDIYNKLTTPTKAKSMTAKVVAFPVHGTPMETGENGVHAYWYGNQPTSMITSEGVRGHRYMAERKRTEGHPILGRRINLYMKPQEDLANAGGIPHRVVLNGVYDAEADPEGLFIGSANDNELAVVSKGYIGYKRGDRIVLLGSRSVNLWPGRSKWDLKR